MYKKSITHYISKVIIDVLFYLSVICTILVPIVAKPAYNFIGYQNVGNIVEFTIIVFLSGVCCSYILFNLKQMYSSLLEGNPFTSKNINHFRKMAVTCTIVSIMYVIKCFFMFTFATLVIVAVFAVGCLFCLTLKDLFKQAENYKAENDLTI